MPSSCLLLSSIAVIRQPGVILPFLRGSPLAVLSFAAMSEPPSPDSTPCFLGLDSPDCDLDQAAAVILPVPFERTVSYGSGTGAGPQAILRASTQVELYDEQAQDEPYRMGIATLPACEPQSADLERAIGEIETRALEVMKSRRFVVALGGEHSLTPAPVRAARKTFGEIGVLQFDAHADLRDTHEGTPWSHACVMRRIHDHGIPSAAVGLRALSEPEGALIRAQSLPVIWGHQLDEAERRFDALLDALPEQVYLTFDLDFFDPAILPATGTPEPGGGAWWPTLRLLARLFARKRVVAMDVVELAPTAGHPASDFLAARLVYKCLGYWWRNRA